MDEVTKLALSYFRPPKNYFWRWAENGEVIEWQNGTTLCYREELITILRGSSAQGMPQLGTLLLTLGACQDNWKQSGGVGILLGILKLLKSKNSELITPELEACIPLAASFMDMINELPRELRSGTKKIHLIHEIFANSVFQVTADHAPVLLDEFNSGRLDTLVFGEGGHIGWQQLNADITRLILALKEYKNKNSLEVTLRTGVYKVPQRAYVALPEPLSLLEQLAEDASTVGIARLTQRLIAALNIPMHSQGSGDQPFGGVSDITNRGNFDRLLLSELAYDDELLMARLVNNEALYLRREEPPDQVDRQRVILIDSTIKMWGVPRLFAISAALACAHTTQPNTSISAYSLGKSNVDEVELGSKKGIIGALERLDAGLDCSKAVASFLTSQTPSNPTEYVLICDEQLTRSIEFQSAIAGLQQSLNFLITVNRNGELHFYEYIKERRKLVSSTKFDLEELLFAPANPIQLPRARIQENQDLPAFLNFDPAPLYFPTSGMRISGANTFYEKDFGVVGINEVQRVLYWPKRESGARELLSFIEKGDYHFGFDEKVLYILVKNLEAQLLKLYQIDTQNQNVATVDLFKEVGLVQEVVFVKNHFHIRKNDQVMSIDCTQGKVLKPARYIDMINAFTEDTNKSRLSPNHVKAHINNGYSTLQRVKNIFVTSPGELHLDNYYIWQIKKDLIELFDDYKGSDKNGFSREMPQRVDESNTWVDNVSIKFTKTVWTDGSAAVVDSRGLLHLRSSDTTIPQITIVLVIGKGTACWAADGTVSGNSYFTGVEPEKSMPARQFYKNYIQRFIDRLL